MAFLSPLKSTAGQAFLPSYFPLTNISEHVALSSQAYPLSLPLPAPDPVFWKGKQKWYT